MKSPISVLIALLAIVALPVPSSSQPAADKPDPGEFPGRTFRECRNCPEMIVLPAGTFTAGSPNATVNPEGLVGLQFQLECQSQDADCVVDITLGEVNLITP